MIHKRTSALLLIGSLVATCSADEPLDRPASQNASLNQSAFEKFVESNYFDGHDSATVTAGMALDDLTAREIGQNQEAWEKVVRKLTARQMPPSEMPRPAEEEYDSAVAWLESSLDAAAATRPNPGRIDTFRRLNRTEYQKSIRDLLALEVDVASLLPPDESSHGFDNVTVTDLSPTLLNR
jgi:hypothetical protein